MKSPTSPCRHALRNSWSGCRRFQTQQNSLAEQPAVGWRLVLERFFFVAALGPEAIDFLGAEGGGVPIYRYMAEGAYGPEETRALGQAYETVLHALHLIDRTDPITEIVAKKILDIWGAGERDPQRIATLASEQLGVPPVAN
jgi:hypothetical protein